MTSKRKGLAIGVGAMLLCVGYAASAQESSNSVIGPPQLKDFSIAPRQRIVTQPEQPQPAQPQPSQREPRAERPTAQPPGAATAQPRREAPASQQAQASEQSADTPAPAPTTVADIPAALPLPEPQTAPAPAPAPAQQSGGTSYWFYALPAAALAFLGVVLVRRRRRNGAEPLADSLAVAAAPPPAPRPDPVPRPWLELSLKAERAAFTAKEAELLFELEIANKGGSAARNLRIDVKMFNAGAEQDKEIGAFFKTAGRESTKLQLPEVPAGIVGVIQGSVRLPVDQMKAIRLDERLLFIPVVAVNALYDYGDGRTGQTAKSYLIGRETEEGAEKMGPFRVDQGPRVWRTVGQRPHKLTKRV